MIIQSAKLEPAELKEMSDTAALLYIEHNVPLSKAVFHVVREKDLTSEHLKRILRAANVRAYLMEYDRASPENRVINFEGGLADYAEILALYDTKEEKPMPIDSLSDYTAAPEDWKVRKELDGLEVPAQETKKAADLSGLYFAVKAAEDKLQGQIVGLEERRSRLASELYGLAKEAMIADHTLGDIVRATASGEGDLTGFIVKTAQGLPDKFWTDEEIAESLKKTSAAKVDLQNPLRRKWLELSEVVKVAQLKIRTRDLLRIKKAEILDIIKEQEASK